MTQSRLRALTLRRAVLIQRSEVLRLRLVLQTAALRQPRRGRGDGGLDWRWAFDHPVAGLGGLAVLALFWRPRGIRGWVAMLLGGAQLVGRARSIWRNLPWP